ncbi:MAG: imidazole glycerol phosphate synthase subunit HisH [Rhodospirillales bacterium]|nr:imidazole glycerol phosphate synthase subunit HisH [Rhodospirillales bacterium]
MTRVALTDFGSGNLLSVQRAFGHLGVPTDLAATGEAIMAAERLVLPGVGAFGACMAELKRRGLDRAVREFAASGRPLLGICVGLQMLFDESSEFGIHAGLGLIGGRVDRLPPTRADGLRHKIPQIGWNAIRPAPDADWSRTILANVSIGTCYYFVHSFAGRPREARHALANTDFNGHPVLAAVARDNLIGVQFHPEKSGPAGLRLLSAFLNWRP